ncbi:MFS transporter [Streptomyces sp. NPDC101118]|uniref:MFS transporter n=1 Tax=Streptomyces sp. NPDC101118 TaxID=3366109 RepID=UPI00382C6191
MSAPLSAAAPPAAPVPARPGALVRRPGTAPRVRRPRPGPALAVIAGANATIHLDDPLMNVALPGIRAELHLTALSASWVVGAYLLAFGGLLLLGGRAGEVLGRRRVFVSGLAVFTLAGTLRALAPNGELLIAVRAAEGAGAALVAANGFVLMLEAFPPGPARTRAIAVCTAVGAASTAGGLLLAGALTSVGSWRWVVLLNVPLGLVLALLAPRVLAESVRIPGRFDAAGAVLSALGAASLVYGLSQAAERPWSSLQVAGPLASGAALLALFVGVQRHTAQPIVRLGVFRDRNRALAYASMLAVPGAVIGAYFFLSQFFQQDRGWSPLAAALALLPVPLTTAALVGFAVREERALGAKRVMAIGAAALLLENLWLTRLGPEDPYATAVLPALVLLGAGLAFCAVPATVLATSGLKAEETGSTGSLLNACQAVGGSLCVALLVTASSGYGSLPEAMSAGFAAAAACGAAVLALALALRPRPRP